MTIDELLDHLRDECARSGSQVSWAKAHDLAPAYLNDVLNRRREPGGKVLAALGVRKMVWYTREAAK